MSSPFNAPDTLALALMADGLRDFEREYQFTKGREWLLDFAFPAIKLGIEVHGGVWSKGRHVRGKGFIEDRKKMNQAQEEGWIVLEYDTQTVKDLECMAQIKRVYERLKKGL